MKLKHPNLTHYLGLKHEEFKEENKTSVYLTREFTFGLSCSSLFLYENISSEIDLLRHISNGVLSALDFLHRNNVVHKDVTDSCIYLSKKGTVKLANYSLDKRLSDILNQTYTANYSKKTDIYQFGVFVLSLIRGDVKDDVEIPIGISSDFSDFLRKCLAKEEKDRFTAAQLLNHSFLKTPLENFSPRRNSEEQRLRRNSSPEIEAVDFISHNSSLGQSRVQIEFQVLSCLGKGAYGEVFKVKNKLDQGYYAIKRIRLDPKASATNKKIIREVKLLSRLNHENVVRYYNSWIEKIVDEDFSSDVSVVTSPAPNLIKNKEVNHFFFIKMFILTYSIFLSCLVLMTLKNSRRLLVPI